MDKVLKGVFALGIIGLAVAFLIPTLVGAASGDSTSYMELHQNDTQSLTDRLSLSLDDVNGTDKNVTVTLRDETDFDNTTAEISTGSQREVQLSGENVTIAVRTVYDANKSVKMAVDYPPMFGWVSGAAVFINNIGVILVLLGGIMLLAILFLVRP